MEIIMNNSQIAVGRSPTGETVIQVTDAQSGLKVIIPMDAAIARQVGTALSTSLIVAGAPLPPEPLRQ